ncbi:unnamed protein product [Schistosoma curassoni]|uniref:Secreted protein n=1 Tax=Schistosoma curassoni TaxID=6186 RepID=A0A183KV67_9TREM|nr:unnamed protein product [Schistosoma curassoni]
MAIRITSVSVLLLTTILLNTCKAVEEYTSQTDATQSLTISDGMMLYDFNRNSKTITLKQSNHSENLTLFNFTEPEESLFEDWIGVSDTFRIEGRSIAVFVSHIAYTSGERQRIELPFSTFKPYFRGKPKPDSPPLD